MLDLAPSAAPALIDAGTAEQLTYADLIERGRARVAPMGLSKGLLFLLCRNDAFTATTYAGCLLGDHAVALLDADQADASIADLVLAYRPPWLAGPSGSADRLAAQGVPVSAVLEQPGGELVRVAAGPAPAIHPELCVLLSTSGTTGSRKLVRLSATNIESNAAAIAAYLELTPDERPITSLPLHYTFGLSILDSHWLAGACVVLTTESLVQGAFWDILRAHGCTSLAGVPYTYLMLERIGFRGMDLPSLRTLQQAGGALDRRLTAAYAEHMATRGGRFFVMYGQTEATARMAYVPPDRLAEKLGSAGIAIPGGRLRIEHDERDGDGGADRTSRAGEVVFEGPNVMLGYASGPDDLALGDRARRGAAHGRHRLPRRRGLPLPGGTQQAHRQGLRTAPQPRRGGGDASRARTGRGRGHRGCPLGVLRLRHRRVPPRAAGEPGAALPPASIRSPPPASRRHPDVDVRQGRLRHHPGLAARRRRGPGAGLWHA